MSKKFFFILIIVILFSYSFCFAVDPRDTEIQYPNIPGITIVPTTVNELLPDYAQYVFSLLITISGLICFASLIYAGAMYLTSAGNPMMQKNATSQILSAFIGIAIIFASYLVSKTINPQLVTSNIGLPTIAGVTLYENNSCNPDPDTGGQNINLTTGDSDIGFDAGSLEFADYNSTSFEVKLFHGVKYEESAEDVLRVASDYPGCLNLDHPTGFTFTSARSALFLWQKPGVYLCAGGIYNGEYCQGTEKYLPFSTGLLDPEFDNNVQGIKFKNATTLVPAGVTSCHEEGLSKCKKEHGGVSVAWTNGTCVCTISKYGAILHKDAGYKGEASIIKNDVANLSAELVEYETSSITTFLQGSIADANPSNIKLCEEDNALYCYEPDSLDKADLGGTGFNNNIGSIIINGKYLVALFEDNDYEGKCQVFFDSDPGFADDPIGRCGCIIGNWGCGSCVSSYKIIPLKGDVGDGGTPPPPPPPPPPLPPCGPPNFCWQEGLTQCFPLANGAFETCDNSIDPTCLSWSAPTLCNESVEAEEICSELGGCNDLEE